MISKEMALIIGEALFYSSLQAALASVEMSSKFSVMNFSKDQETLQRAADALRGYIIIATIWTVGTLLALWAIHGICGLWIGLAANVVIMGWIVLSYLQSFKEAARRYNLEMPVVFGKGFF